MVLYHVFITFFIYILLPLFIKSGASKTDKKNELIDTTLLMTKKEELKLDIEEFFPNNKEIDENSKSPPLNQYTTETTLVPYQVLNTESTTISASSQTTTKKMRKFNR